MSRVTVLWYYLQIIICGESPFYFALHGIDDVLEVLHVLARSCFIEIALGILQAANLNAGTRCVVVGLLIFGEAIGSDEQGIAPSVRAFLLGKGYAIHLHQA